jgi:hypothetical protein
MISYSDFLNIVLAVCNNRLQMNLRLKHNGLSLYENKFRTCVIVGLISVGCISCDGDANWVDIAEINHTVSDKNLKIDDDESDFVDLEVTGDRNTITITAKTGVAGFTLTGSNNLIIFESGAINLKIIGNFTIDGDDNTIQHPADVSFTNLVDNGVGNTLIVF